MYLQSKQPTTDHIQHNNGDSNNNNNNNNNIDIDIDNSKFQSLNVNNLVKRIDQRFEPMNAAFRNKIASFFKNRKHSKSSKREPSLDQDINTSKINTNILTGEEMLE